jgi:ribosome-interacting GTPase 1
MSSFLLRFFLKQLGIGNVIDEVKRELLYDEVSKILNKRYSRIDSISILNEILGSYGINLDIKVKEDNKVDDVRRMAAIAANMTLINIDNPEEVLWKIAQSIKPKRRVKDGY